MQKIFLSGLSRVKWGRFLLPAGLLLVAVAGFLQLYEVQTFLFPKSYYATQLNVIKKECNFIDKGFRSLQAEMAKLDALCPTAGQLSSEPNPLSSAVTFAPQTPDRPRSSATPAWLATLHAAKKNRVYVARKLRYLEARLLSMERVLEQSETSHDVSWSKKRRPGLEKTLQQIQGFQIRCETYGSQLAGFTEKLNQLEVWGTRASIHLDLIRQP